MPRDAIWLASEKSFRGENGFCLGKAHIYGFQHSDGFGKRLSEFFARRIKGISAGAESKNRRV